MGQNQPATAEREFERLADEDLPGRPELQQPAGASPSGRVLEPVPLLTLELASRGAAGAGQATAKSAPTERNSAELAAERDAGRGSNRRQRLGAEVQRFLRSAAAVGAVTKEKDAAKAPTDLATVAALHSIGSLRLTRLSMESATDRKRELPQQSAAAGQRWLVEGPAADVQVLLQELRRFATANKHRLKTGETNAPALESAALMRLQFESTAESEPEVGPAQQPKKPQPSQPAAAGETQRRLVLQFLRR